MVLHSFLGELEKRGESPDAFNLYATEGGEALTEVPPWERMQTTYISRAVAEAWAEQGHVRMIDLAEAVATDPSLLGKQSKIHGDDTRPLVIDTSKAAALVERALFPTPGTRYYLKPSPTDPPAWVASTAGGLGAATSVWLVYLVLNLAGLALMLWLTASLPTRPGLSAGLRVGLAALCLYGLVYVGNGFFEFRSAANEDFGAYFGRVRFMSLALTVVSLWVVAKKLGRWLNKVVIVILLLPLIWVGMQVSFLALPPHEYVTYPWLLSLGLYVVVAAMAPEILTRWRARRSRGHEGPLLDTADA